MLGKAALVVKSKIALAVIGVLVAGTGGTAALAATGHMPTLPGASPTQAQGNGANSNHGHTVGIEGTLTAYNAGAKTISVRSGKDNSSSTITVNAQTRVNGAQATQLSDLSANIGHKVQVQADKQQDGSLVAWKITVEGATDGGDDNGQANASSQTVAGVVTQVTASGFVVKTATGESITVTTNGQTTFRGADGAVSQVKVGMRVEARGARQSDGSILAGSVQVENGQGTGQSGDHGGGD